MDYKNELKKTILPFWLTHALDTENGGFLTDCGLLENVSTDGKPLDAPAGRIINPS